MLTHCDSLDQCDNPAPPSPPLRHIDDNDDEEDNVDIVDDEEADDEMVDVVEDYENLPSLVSIDTPVVDSSDNSESNVPHAGTLLNTYPVGGYIQPNTNLTIPQQQQSSVIVNSEQEKFSGKNSAPTVIQIGYYQMPVTNNVSVIKENIYRNIKHDTTSEHTQVQKTSTQTQQDVDMNHEDEEDEEDDEEEETVEKETEMIDLETEPIPSTSGEIDPIPSTSKDNCINYPSTIIMLPG